MQKVTSALRSVKTQDQSCKVLQTCQSQSHFDQKHAQLVEVFRSVLQLTPASVFLEERKSLGNSRKSSLFSICFWVWWVMVLCPGPMTVLWQEVHQPLVLERLSSFAGALSSPETRCSAQALGVLLAMRGSSNFVWQARGVQKHFRLLDGLRELDSSGHRTCGVNSWL